MTEQRGNGGLAPVIPLFGQSAPGLAPAPGLVPAPELVEGPPAWHSAWDDEDSFDGDEVGHDECGAIEREIAERNLLKRLRTRQLSVAEARRLVAERDLAPDDVESLLGAFCRRGYLDDARLAEQLVHTAIDRRAQGRTAIARTLTMRGIPRDIADAALIGLPDDDAERALEFARGKARSMAGLDRATAERRLAGQLARRGFGAVALSVARQALDEPSRGAGARSVRFE
ncbi:MAG: regulatory protein RecX [Microbacterium sp.]|uniref:regulatory protein RecX n=1 Tax=Microbacterium sp. TaxID=51671 RepID=UPI0039E2E55F